MALRTKLILAASLTTLAFTSGAFAQAADPAPTPGHPRVNEVEQRLNNQENRTDAGVNSGTITARQEEHDNARDARVSSQMAADEAKHNGHLTKPEQRHLNRELNRNSQAIHRQREEPGSATAPAAAH